MTRTLPSAWYVDAETHARELERIFDSAWQYAGPAERVAQPGTFLATTAGRVPIVAVRDQTGSLNAFVNVCRHRGSEVVREPYGRRKTLQCGYHAWTYALDGSLRAAPGTEAEPDFDRDSFSLPRAAAATWGPFLFVHPEAGAPPLAEALGELPAILAEAGLDLDRLRPRRDAEYEIAANWKVVVDNYLECYHCPVAHPSFADLIDLNEYTVTEYEAFSVQRGPARDDGDGIREGVYAFVWPNFTINVYPGPGNVSINLFAPRGSERTLARYDYYFADEVGDAEIDEFVAFVDQVQREDTALCESVQRGLASGRLESGRLVLSREHALRHFQRLVTRALEPVS